MFKINLRKQQWMCSFASLLILYVVIVSVNYGLARIVARGDYPFALSPQFREYHRAADGHVSIDFLKDMRANTDITLLTKGEGLGSTMGIWDPRMYFGNTLYSVLYGTTRYFSMEDYDKATDAKAIVLHDTYDDAPYPGYIFTITEMSNLYAPDVNEVQNLFSLQHLGESVWIDADDEKNLAQAEAALLRQGYSLIRDGRISLLRGLQKTLFHDAYSTLVLFIPFGMYLIWAFASFALFSLNQKKLALSRVFGGQQTRVFLHLATPFFGHVCLAFPMILLVYLWLKKALVITAITTADFFLIVLFHTLLCLGIMYIAYLINHKVVGKRVIYYVK
ncbi:MAG: hypothetical protein ACOYI6_09745 [Christensenellales bacterium]|jgi:hypothetical protein